jgi:hypothetical protein
MARADAGLKGVLERFLQAPGLLTIVATDIALSHCNSELDSQLRTAARGRKKRNRHSRGPTLSRFACVPARAAAPVTQRVRVVPCKHFHRMLERLDAGNVYITLEIFRPDLARIWADARLRITTTMFQSAMPTRL